MFPDSKDGSDNSNVYDGFYGDIYYGNDLTNELIY